MPLGRWLCLALVAAATGCGRAAAPASAPAGTPPVAVVTAPQMSRLLAERTHTITLLHFWATWCPPCVGELPQVVALAKQYQGRGVRVLLVSADAERDRDAVARFLSDRHVDWQTYLAANLNDDFIKAISSKWSGALPASFFYAADGTLTEWWEGACAPAAYEQALDRLLQPRQGASKP